MPNVKTITLTGEETAVTFEDSYPYYFITNMDDGEIYASGNPNIVPYADGVYTVLTGVETRISPERSGDTVYLLGSGKVQVRAETIAVPASFKRTQKGGDGSAGNNILPHSKGLTYYFDVDKGVDLDQKVWRDQVQGLEIPIADTQNFSDAVTNAEFTFPGSGGQWAYTYYIISRYDASEAWKLVIGSFGNIPQFNLTNNNLYYAIGTGSASGQMRQYNVGTNGQFTINCLNYQSGYGEWYCHRYSMTQPVDKYPSYYAPNNGDIVIGDNNNFKAIAIFKNISQGRDMILENMAFFKNKFELD